MFRVKIRRGCSSLMIIFGFMFLVVLHKLAVIHIFSNTIVVASRCLKINIVLFLTRIYEKVSTSGQFNINI